MTIQDLNREQQDTSRQLPDPLSASRRLDWRFLFPRPALNRIAHIGPADSSLRASLEGFVDSIVSLSPAKHNNTQPQFDMVVLEAPSLTVFRQALPLANMIYAESPPPC